MNKSLDWFENNVIYRVPLNYPGAGPARLSGLPAARRLHRDEPGPPPEVALRLLPRPGARRRRQAPTSTASSTTSTTRCSTCRPSTTSTRSRPCSRTSRSSTAPGTSTGELVRPQDITTHRAADDRGRARRHLRRRPDPGRARPVHRHPEGAAVPLRRRRRRPLRHLLGPPLAREGLSRGARLHRALQPRTGRQRARQAPAPRRGAKARQGARG